MSALDPNAMRKLKASLARLASPHDGEIIAAAKAAERILTKAGLGFQDLGPVSEALTLAHPKPRATAASDDYRHRVLRLIGTGCNWTEFERSFLSDLSTIRPHRPLSLSPKQLSLLYKLEAKAARWVDGDA